MSEVKKYTIDRSTWRCGGDVGDNVIGKGRTALLNKEKFMCCLGQIAAQEGIDCSSLLELGDPAELQTNIPLLTKEVEDGYDGDSYFSNTDLSGKAMEINDEEETTIEKKEASLKQLFKEYNVEIEFINEPVIP